MNNRIWSWVDQLAICSGVDEISSRPPKGQRPNSLGHAVSNYKVKHVGTCCKGTSQIHNYRTRSVSSSSFYVKFPRTDKMYAFFSRIGVQIWNPIPYSIKLLERKKIKELLTKWPELLTKFLAVRR